MRSLLDETTARGFSIGNQGIEAGVVSTAAPIRAPGGRPIGCVAIAAPMVRADQAALMDFGAEVAAAASAISEKYYGSERPTGTSAQIRRTG